MKKLFALAATLMLTVRLMLVAVPQALACPGVNEWSVDVTPSTVEEGGSVHITVRNEQATDSGVTVETLEESARDGKDYTGMKRTVYMYGLGTVKFTVPITNDTTTEPAETFKVRLSDPKQNNCSYGVNHPPGRVYDDVDDTDTSDAGTYILPEPVTVTIAANDAASTPPATSPTSKASPAPRTSPSPGQSPAPSGSSQSTSSSPALTDTAGLGLASKPPPSATNVEQVGEHFPVAPGAEASESLSPPIRARKTSGGGDKAATIAFIAVLAAAGAGVGLRKFRRT